ncbi:MAG: molybdopterin-dependent oxidoreductase [Micromonosporaceae bacterium]
MKSWRVVGLLSAAAGLGTSELVAAWVSPGASPYFAVADAVVDLTPTSVRETSIAVFGPWGKLVLLAGVAAVLVACAIAIGRLAERSLRTGLVGVGVLSGIGLAAAVTRPGAGVADAVPSVVGGFVAGAVLVWLSWLVRDDGVPEEAEGGYDRRRFLIAGGVVAAGAVVAAAAGQWVSYGRYGAARSRAALRVPRPDSPASGVARDAAADVPQLSRFHTPNRDFYRVDTALTVPQVRADEWALEIHGMVDRPMRITYEQLLSRTLIERDITLACVSNPVGGPYVGNARWIGVALKELLDEVGVRGGADQVVSRSHDGMTIGTPTAALTDGRDAMLAVAMNGELLPLEHGFPVRMVVPGLYGYVSACKWIVDMELTTFEAYDAYWIKQGWAEQAEIKTASRIDTPRPGAEPAAGEVVVGGVAWAQHRGIDRVEVRVDDGRWQPAELASTPSVDTWRQWTYRWQATPGPHRLGVRATDGDGITQTDEKQDSYPDGATGWHQVEVTVGG